MSNAEPIRARPETFRVGLVQMRMEEDRGANLERAAAKVDEAARRGARVICLPELFRSRYFCQTEESAAFDWAETIPGPSTEALGKLAKARGVVLLAPLFERRAPGLYHNTVAVIGADGRLLGRYRKMHIPDDPGFYEKFYFTPGDLGFPVFDTPFGKLGVLICWDQWYPEAARLTALQGADILFYPSAIGWAPEEMRSTEGLEQLEAWRTTQRAHAISNGVYVASVNRFGHEQPLSFDSPDPQAARTAKNQEPETKSQEPNGLIFWGSSFLCDPFGTVLEEAPTDAEAILIGEVDPGRIEEVRRQWPFLRDRRVDAYGGIERLFREPHPGG